MSAGLHHVRQRLWRQQRSLSVPQRSPGGAEHHHYQVGDGPVLQCWSIWPLFSVTQHSHGTTVSFWCFGLSFGSALELASPLLPSFNPVAPTAMMKVLTRISTAEAGKVSGRAGAGRPLSSICSPQSMSSNRAVGRRACWTRQRWNRCAREAPEMSAAPSTAFSSCRSQVGSGHGRPALAPASFHPNAGPFVRLSRQRNAEQKRQICTFWNQADQEGEAEKNQAAERGSCDWGQGRVSLPVQGTGKDPTRQT